MMSTIRLRKLAWFLLLPCIGWGGENLPEKNEIAKTIVRYNEGIAKAGRSGKVDHLRPFASEKIVQKTYLWVHSWQDSNYYMRAEPQKIDFKEFRVDHNSSNVRTYEEWEYDYYDAAAKNSAMPKTKANYEMRYTLHPHHGKWVIDEIKILNEKHTPIEKNGEESKPK